MQGETRDAELLTTREVASLLRIKERKVYDLVASGEIPHVRVTGKLLFPRALLDAWLLRHSEAHAAPRAWPDIVAGSHDPLLDWALRESGAGLATFFDGSLDGLERIARGDAIAAGLHWSRAPAGTSAISSGGLPASRWCCSSGHSASRALFCRPAILRPFAARAGSRAGA